MTANPTFTRKTVSLDADLVEALEPEARQDGRSLSNLVNFRLRQFMEKATTPAKRGKTIRKGGGV